MTRITKVIVELQIVVVYAFFVHIYNLKEEKTPQINEPVYAVVLLGFGLNICFASDTLIVVMKCMERKKATSRQKTTHVDSTQLLFLWIDRASRKCTTSTKVKKKQSVSLACLIHFPLVILYIFKFQSTLIFLDDMVFWFSFQHAMRWLLYIFSSKQKHQGGNELTLNAEQTKTNLIYIL